MNAQANIPLTNPVLVPFWEELLLGENDGGVLYGGRSSSKTRDTACQVIRLVDHIGVRMRILCVRRFQNRIQDSVYVELKWAINHLGLQREFDIQKTTIIHKVSGAEFLFYGIERNIQEIKGTSDVDILWVEEAEKLTKDQWAIMEPTIRKEDSLTILLFNPRFATDFVWQNFVINTPEHWVVRSINYTENQFLSDKALRDIAQMKEREPEMFTHIYLGVPLGESDLSIFKRRWLDACVDAHKVLNIKLTGRNVIGFDPADDGEDKCAEAVKIDGVFSHVEDWQSGKDELVQNTKRVRVKAQRLRAVVSYDTIGIGAFIGGYIKEQNEEERDKHQVEHYAFHAGGSVMDGDKPSDPDNKKSPLNKDEYLNLKSQAWANTARKAMLTYNAVARGQSISPKDVLSFSSSIPEKTLDSLFIEMCVPWWVESENKKRVVPKKKLKDDLGIKSHNLADAVIAADNIVMGTNYNLSQLVG